VSFGAIGDLLRSEKGVAGGALFMDRMSVDEWSYYTGAIYGGYATTKTAQGIFAKRAEKKAEEANQLAEELKAKLADNDSAADDALADKFDDDDDEDGAE
jgi:hypothetical protein